MANIKLITSNIRYANSSDGIHDWKFRRPLLADIFMDLKPDILGTQEGRIGQIKELAADLKELTLIEGHRKWIDERMYPCLFINPETMCVGESGDIWLSETPAIAGSISFASSFPRLCVWAEITIKETGLKMMVVNTHLDHVLASTRQEQVKVLIKEIQKITTLPVFIMGDFNQPPSTRIKKEIMRAFNLKDPWVEKRLPEETTHHGFRGKELLTGDRIDWILIPRSFECQSLSLDKRTGPGEIYPSDHYPLVATVIPR